MHPSLKDTLVFSNYCWESTSNRIRYIVLSLIKKQRIFYVEPPILGMTSFAKLNEAYNADGIIVLTPYLPLATEESERNKVTQELLQQYLNQESINFFDSWYFSHQSWDYSKDLTHQNIIYNIDRPNELDVPIAEFANNIFSSERMSDDRATYIADGVDIDHFSQARLSLIRPDDMASLTSPKVGCYGIYDPMLIEDLAERRTDLNFIFLTQEGSIKKDNVHYLGPKSFYSLPLYISHWDVAITADRDNHMMELLASGTPTILLNEEEPLNLDLVHEARNIDEIISKIDLALQQNTLDPYWIDRVDLYLQNKNWDHQVELMLQGQRLDTNVISTPLPLIQ